MSETVVDLLEMIEVEKQQRQRFAGLARLYECGAQLREDRAAVQDAGQRVVFGEPMRDVALVPERQRLAGQYESKHEIGVGQRSRQPELEPDRQRPLHAQLQDACDDQQQRRNPCAQEEAAAAPAVHPGKHRGSDQQRNRQQQQDRQRILDPPAARNDRRDRTQREREEQPCESEQRAMQPRRPARELEKRSREEDIETDRHQRSAPRRSLRHRRQPVQHRKFIPDAEDVQLVEHEKQCIRDEVRVHAFAQYEKERKHDQQRGHLHRRKQHVEARARQITGAVFRNIANFDAARDRAFRIEVQIDRRRGSKRIRQLIDERVPRETRIVTDAVDAAGLRAIIRRRVELRVQPDRIEHGQHRRRAMLQSLESRMRYHTP